MPRFFKENLLSNPLDTPELPADDKQAQDWEHPRQQENQQQNYDLDEDNPVKTLLSWKAASRPFRKKDRSYYTTILILVTLISLIALLAGEKVLIGALFALFFLVYVLNHVVPEEIEYKISTQGVTIADHFYHWQELDSFWFSEKESHKLLNILTRYRFPGVLMIVLGREADDERVKKVVARYLPFHEIAPKSLMDKWSESLQKHFPLENPHKV